MESKFSAFTALVSGAYLASGFAIIGAGPAAERPDCLQPVRACEFQDGQEPEAPPLPLGVLTHPIATTTSAAMSVSTVIMGLPDWYPRI